MNARASITRTATLVLAIAALAAPSAIARPADRATAASTPAAAQAARSAPVGDRYPTRPAQGEQANPPLSTPPQAPADGGGRDTIGLGLGVAAALLALAAAIAVMTRGARRLGRPRTTV
jgi:hypothetical protein